MTREQEEELRYTGIRVEKLENTVLALRGEVQKLLEQSTGGTKVEEGFIEGVRLSTLQRIAQVSASQGTATIRFEKQIGPPSQYKRAHCMLIDMIKELRRFNSNTREGATVP